MKTLPEEIFAFMHCRCRYTPEAIAQAMGRDERQIAEILEQGVKAGVIARDGAQYRKFPKPRKKRTAIQIDWVGKSTP